MKLSKKLCAFSVAAVMSLSVCAPAFAEEAVADNTVDVQFNGKTTEDAALLVDGTTYIKAADVKTLLGVDCTVTDGKAVLTVDGKAVNIDAQVVEEDLIPVRALTTALDCSLGWDDTAKTVIVVDVDKMVAESGQTFEIIGKYMDYALSLGDSYKTTSEFSGNVEVIDESETLALPFNGTTEGITSAKGEDMTMKLSLDFTQIREMLEAQGLEDADKEAMETILKALESSETKYIYDIENNIFYMNSSMFEAFGISADAWVSLDLASIFDMSMSTGYDMSSIMELAMSGDINGYVTELLKATPVVSVNSYAEIAEAYDLVASMLGDKAFILADGQYKSSFAFNENGTELTYAMTMGTDGDKVNSCEITMKMAAEGVTMDMNVATDKDFNSTMTFAFNLLDMMKMSMDYKAKSEVTTEAPQFTIPEGAPVISLNDILAGTATITAEGVVAPVPETAAEVTNEGTTAEVPAEDAEAETPETAEDAVEDTTVPAEEIVEAESTTTAA